MRVKTTFRMPLALVEYLQKTICFMIILILFFKILQVWIMCKSNEFLPRFCREPTNLPRVLYSSKGLDDSEA